jgi:hypothetical protein
MQIEHAVEYYEFLLAPSGELSEMADIETR